MIVKDKPFQILAHIIMLLLALFCIIPFLLLIASSVTNEHVLIREGYSLWPKKLDFSAYKYLLLDSSDIIRGYMISFGVTISGTLINIVLTTLFAYPLSRKDLPGRGIISFFLFFTMLFNGGLVPSYIMWTQVFHIKNTIFALLVPNLMLNAFNIIMMRTYLNSNIPEALIEAAKIDGAAELTTLIRIVLPLTKPIISTLALLVGLGYWNDWLNGLYYTNSKKLYGVQVLLNKMLMDAQFLISSAGKGLNVDTSTLPTIGIKMAVAVLGALPIMVIYPFLQRYLVKGITIGAVKG
jgi:putative aldouronate transport system permease protein